MTEHIVHFCLEHIELILVGVLSLIQIAPIKINPWSKVGKWIVDKVSGEVMQEIKTVRADVEKMQEELEDVSEEVDKSNARQSRVRILRFDDELLRKDKHTKDHFRQIIEDIDVYEDYCNRHPGFRNGVAIHAIAHIKTVYDDLEKNGGFLE